ncbi:hypothetical protein I4U23_015154 [Adineta vaga]|nr:hypothetical protein I4U23_015154 [Adineta vaga]
MYFFILSIAHFNNLTFGLFVNYLGDAHRIDILTTTMFFCRFRFFILHSSLALSSWVIVLAGIDRFCISSRHANRRQFSTLKNARLAAMIATMICCIIYSHVLILFTIEQTPTGPMCYAQSGTYRVFYDFLFLATFSFTPPIIMIIVGLATFHNILQVRSVINPQITASTSNHSLHLQKKDRQYLKMLLIQLAFTVSLTLPIAIQKLYATFTQNQVKSASQLEVESFAAQAVRTLTQINSCLSFYLYTLSGTIFRRELIVIMIKLIKFIFGVNSCIYQQLQRTIRPTSTNHTMMIGRHTIDATIHHK